MARAAFAKLTIDENAPSVGGKFAQLSLDPRIDSDTGKPAALGLRSQQQQQENYPSKTDQILNIFKKPLGNATVANVRQVLRTSVPEQAPPPPVQQPVQKIHRLQNSLVSKIPKLSRHPKASSLESKKPFLSQKSSPTQEIPDDIEDIDNVDATDAIFQMADFVKDIYAYLKQLESIQTINPNFLKHQPVLTPKVRARLVNWCIGVHSRFDLLPETLYLSIAIMDRYFQIEKVDQSRVQLVGMAAMFIASKYEEIYPPELNDFIKICNGEYTRRDILRSEIQILKKLNFDLGRPLPLSFLRRYSKAAHSTMEMHTVAKYLMELTLTEYECAHWKPSLLAATSTYLTVRLFNDGEWSRSLVHYSGYTAMQLKPHAVIMCKIIKRSRSLGTQLSCVKKYLKISSNTDKDSGPVPTWPQLSSPLIDELAGLAP